MVTTKGRKIKIGLASRLRLEMPADLMGRLQAPVSADLTVRPDGKVLVYFRHDPIGTCSWGQLNEKYNLYPLEVTRNNIRFDGAGAKDVKFTFTIPESVVWQGDGLLCVMPSVLAPPRQLSAPRKITRKTARSLPPEVPPVVEFEAAADGQLQVVPALPLTPSVQDIPEGVRGAETRDLVRELNMRLRMQRDRLGVALDTTAGVKRVVVTETLT